MRISSKEYEGLKQRIYAIIENEVWCSDDYLIEGILEATDTIMNKVVDQLVKVEEITW